MGAMGGCQCTCMRRRLWGTVRGEMGGSGRHMRGGGSARGTSTATAFRGSRFDDLGRSDGKNNGANRAHTDPNPPHDRISPLLHDRVARPNATARSDCP